LAGFLFGVFLCGDGEVQALADLRRVIEFTYFRPAPKQEVTAQQLGLAFGTYRRHLTTALDRLARWLWDRERGLRA
jgi:hypothetical protein